jgi:site-specific recombinase XerD
MSALRQALEAYLTLRRRLGSVLRGPGYHLHSFIDFLDAEGATTITTKMALQWATAPRGVTPATWGQRLANVRRFATWLSTTDPRTEIPPPGLLPGRYRRRQPYIYSDKEVEHIVREAARLPSPIGLRAYTFATLFGLLASAGLRLGEAIALHRDDVDLHAGIVAVRRAKFGKSRFVPVHDSTRLALRRYARRRDRIVPRPVSPAFFIAEHGTWLTQRSAEQTFALVSRLTGLRPWIPRHGSGRAPRLHDMRHRLAVKVLLRWYQQGRDVERELPKLSTYLGHVHVADTYWYIEAVPQLLRLATERVTERREQAP